MPEIEAEKDVLKVAPVFVGQPDGDPLVVTVTVGDTESVDVIVGVYESVATTDAVEDRTSVRETE